MACQEALACGAYGAARSALDQLHAACAAASDAALLLQLQGGAGGAAKGPGATTPPGPALRLPAESVPLRCLIRLTTDMHSSAAAAAAAQAQQQQQQGGSGGSASSSGTGLHGGHEQDAAQPAVQAVHEELSALFAAVSSRLDKLGPSVFFGSPSLSLPASSPVAVTSDSIAGSAPAPAPPPTAAAPAPAWQAELEWLGHSAWNAGLAAAKARAAQPTTVLLASAAGILAHHPAPTRRMHAQRKVGGWVGAQARNACLPARSLCTT